VPGSPLDPRCRGTNGLIRNGATMVENAGDVLSVVAAMRGGMLAEPPSEGFSRQETAGEIPDEIRDRIVEALGPSPAPVDAIIRDLDLPAPVVLTVLLELELAGKLERQPGNMAVLVGGGE